MSAANRAVVSEWQLIHTDTHEMQKEPITPQTQHQ